jgi:signal transduction histidine kinase
MAAAGPGRSAFFRFAVLLPLLISVVAGLIFLPVYYEAVQHIRNEVHAAIERESWDLEVEFHEGGIEGLIAKIEERTERDLDPRTIYLLIDAGEQVLAGNLQLWPPLAKRLDRAWVVFRTDDGEHAEGQVFQLFGGRTLLVGRRSPLASFDEHLALQLGVAVLAVFLLSAFAASWFTRRMRRRLSGLALDAEAIRGGDLGGRLVISARHDEIDTLADRFNRTFADLERLVDGTRQVSSHLAHDLRRPLQTARQRLDQLARSHALESGAQQVIEASIAEIDSLLATFAALLRLARLQAGGFERSQQQIQLDQVVADAVEMYQPVAQQADRQIIARIDPQRSRGDRHLWFQLLQNLIENALNHGAGDIEVRLDTHGELSVRDHGPGVSPELLARLGERFFRADPARSAPGVGIGLALSRAIAEHHGATLTFENAEPGLIARVRGATPPVMPG